MSKIREQIETWLKPNGYELGRFGVADHDCGLPATDRVMVRPDYSPVDGGHTLAVTATEILQCVCPYPSNYNDWRVMRRYSYANPAELKRVLDQLVSKPQGCWS